MHAAPPTPATTQSAAVPESPEGEPVVDVGVRERATGRLSPGVGAGTISVTVAGR